MYSPTDEIDFEGLFDGHILKKVGKAFNKVADATIVKPSAMIGGMIAGKRGREWGEKLGGLTKKVTGLGLAAGAAGLPGAPEAMTALAAKKLLGKKKRKMRLRAAAKHHRKHAHKRHKHPGYRRHHRMSHDDLMAMKVAAELVKKLGGPLAEANKHLRMAELQRQATYEHRKLMADAGFRKKVLSLITHVAACGDEGCERTVRVIMQR